MTNEEAIKILESGSDFPLFPHTIEMVDEACRMACEALRKENKLDRSKWNGCEYCKADSDGYSTCFKDRDGKSTNLYIPDEEPIIAVSKVTAHYNRTKYVKIHFCPFCGRPLTESAWKEIEVKVNNE